MTLTQQMITILMVVLGTMLTRFLPFLLFPADKPTPKYIQYLGNVLPAADASANCRRNTLLYAAGAVYILTCIIENKII